MGSVASRHVVLIAVAAAVVMAACSSKPTPPEHFIDVTAPQGVQASFNMYRPGSILDEWMALDVTRGGEMQSLVHIGYCDRIAARISEGAADVVIFRGRASVTALHYFESEPYEPTYDVNLKSFDRRPGTGELESLADLGFTVSTCPPNKAPSDQ